MPRNAIEQARRDRNAALIDAMILAASADGQLKSVELQTLIRRVIERPEFEGVHTNELAGMVETSARRLSQAKALDEILADLRARLVDHRSRLLAFGLATSIVLADRQSLGAKLALGGELGLLKALQQGLGLSEDDVSRVFETVEAGRCLAEALGEPLERLYSETMVMVSAADGEVRPQELSAMMEELAGDPVFGEVSLEAADHYLRDAVHHLALEGLPQRLTVLARGLTSKVQRLKAFRLAVHVAYADGEPSADALRTLDLLQATFALRDEDVARITAER